MEFDCATSIHKAGTIIEKGKPRRPAEGGTLLRKQPGGVSRSMKVLPILENLPVRPQKPPYLRMSC